MNKIFRLFFIVYGVLFLFLGVSSAAAEKWICAGACGVLLLSSVCMVVVTFTHPFSAD